MFCPTIVLALILMGLTSAFFKLNTEDLSLVLKHFFVNLNRGGGSETDTFVLMNDIATLYHELELENFVITF